MNLQQQHLSALHAFKQLGVDEDQAHELATSLGLTALIILEKMGGPNMLAMPFVNTAEGGDNIEIIIRYQDGQSIAEALRERDRLRVLLARVRKQSLWSKLSAYVRGLR